MEHDEGKIDEMVLALLYLTTFKDGPSLRAWKGQDWAAMERLYKAGYIADPQNKAKSVRMTEEGLENRENCSKGTLFGRPSRFQANFSVKSVFRLPNFVHNVANAIP